MVKDAERKLGGIERPLLREMNVLMLKDAEQKPEKPLLLERYARSKIVSDIMHEEKLIIQLHCLASLLSIKR